MNDMNKQMASLLPHRNIEYADNFDVLVDGKVCASTDQREAILREYKINSKCVQFDSLKTMKQGMVTSEQRKIIKIYFDNMPFPFSQSSYLSAAKTGSELVDFRKIISISKSYAGGFWVNFFRALYKSGTQKDLQDMIDYTTSIIMRFSLLGNPSSNVATGICQDFIENINYQINQVREISIKEVDWLGVIPISDRIAEMKSSYVKLIDTSNITETVSRDDLISMLDLLIMNGICDVVMMTKQPKSIKLGMINDAVEFSGIHAELTPEQYVHEIANNTDLGRAYKEMLSSGPPLGQLWHIIYMMGGQTSEADAAIGITYNMISVLIQVENYLDEKYNFLGRESIAQNYMMHIVKQLAEVYD